MNEIGTGSYSAVSAASTPRTVPGIPTVVTGTASNGAVRLSWTAPASNGGAAITDYLVQYSSSNGSSWTTFADGTSPATSALVTGLTNGTAYVFRVAAVNPAGNGDYSVASTAVTPAAAVITNGQTRTSVGYFSTSVGNGGQLSRSGATAVGRTGQQYIDQNFIYAYTTYVAVGTNGQAQRLSDTTVTTPGAIVSPGVVASEGSLQGANGLVRWRVESSFDSAGTRFVNRLSFQSDQPLGTLRVISYLDQDVLSPVDDVLNPVGDTNSPSFLAFTRDGAERIGFAQGGIYLPGTGLVNATFNGWAADRYSALRSGIEAGTAQYSVQGTINPNNLPAIANSDFGAAYGPADIATAFAWSVAADARSSVVTTGLTFLPTDIGTPTAVTATPGNGQVALSWTAPTATGGAAITDYLVQYSTDNGTSWTTFDDGVSTTTTATVTGLTNGTPHLFRVAAVNVGGTGRATNSSAVTPRTVPGTPTAVTGTFGDQQVNLS